MKKLMLLLLAATLGYHAMADNKPSSANMPDITALKAGKTTDKEVEAMLGKPTNTQTGDYNKYARWEYRTNEMKLNIEWNTKNMTIERYRFTYNQSLQKDKEWNNDDIQYLVAGESKFNAVLHSLGAPTEIGVDKDAQTVKYSYKKHTVMLRFSKGLLVDMTINYLEWKKDKE